MKVCVLTELKLTGHCTTESFEKLIMLQIV